MTEPPPHPRVSNKVSPLAVIVVIILIGIVVVALVKQHGHHVSASGVAAPMAAPSNAIMPKQSSAPNHLAPRAHTNDAVEASPSGNETGIPGAGGPGNSSQ